jgi:hypothetical protein
MQGMRMIKTKMTDISDDKKNPTNAEMPIVRTISAKKETKTISVGRKPAGWQYPSTLIVCLTVKKSH